MFFSFAVSFAIYLCTNEMSHLAGRVCVWTAQDLQPWIDVNGSWVSSDICMHINSLSAPSSGEALHIITLHS